MPSTIDRHVLRTVMPHARERDLDRFLVPLGTTLGRYGISGSLRMAHFLAQIAHESGQLAFTEELASGAAYEGRRDLGNVQPGDGVRFKGRGLIQVTGRSNYQAYSTACGRDLLTGSNPGLLATDTDLAADVAGWFWHRHGLNMLADKDDLVRITKCINGGLNGFTQREAYLEQAKAALASPPVPDHPSEPAPLPTLSASATSTSLQLAA